jgi:glycosyltransferase involved in cell wall biosynthesis
MKSRKVIHLAYTNPADFDGIVDQDLFIEKLTMGFAKSTCCQLNRIPNKYDFECWRFASRSVYRKWRNILPITKYGIRFDLVPAHFPHLFSGAYNFVRKVLKERRDYHILLHLYRYHEIPMLIALLFLRRLPILCAHLGYSTRGNMHFFEKFIFKKVDYFFVETDYEEKYLSTIVGNQRIRYRVTMNDIHYFKPSDKIVSRERLGLPIDNKIVLFAGRFTKVKGVDILIDAVRSLKEDFDDLTLVMVGGYESNDLYNLVYDSEIQIIKKPVVDRETLASYYNAADVFVLPSRMEGTSGVVIESLLCDLPVIFTDTGGGNLKLIEQNKTGICIPPESSKNPGIIKNDLVNALRTVFNKDNKFEDMRKVFLSRYNHERETLLTLRLYDRLYKHYYR